MVICIVIMMRYVVNSMLLSVGLMIVVNYVLSVVVVYVEMLMSSVVSRFMLWLWMLFIVLEIVVGIIISREVFLVIRLFVLKVSISIGMMIIFLLMLMSLVRMFVLMLMVMSVILVSYVSLKVVLWEGIIRNRLMIMISRKLMKF